MDWTEKMVQEQLPPIDVQLESGDIVRGKVTGRKLKFADVVTTVRDIEVAFTASWKTIAHCLNANKPLKM